ncbi:hypothetical protein ACFFVB_18295 [Formosa undariae]|uniref:Uncharacterized protein n=1 Tax=Formosa undariae TaxID=1325436 RepID=A0ABV5F6G0_9FLAO
MGLENKVIQTVKNDKLIDFLNIKLNQNEQLMINSFAVLYGEWLIDPDSCFWPVCTRYENNEFIKYIDIECRIKKQNPDGSFRFRIDRADFIHSIKLTDYIYLSEQMMLTDYLRYNYNPRIIRNQNLLIEAINNN